MNLANDLRKLAPDWLPRSRLDRLIAVDWREELIQCMPRPVGRWLLDRARHLLVVPRGTTADLYSAVGSERERLGSIELSSPGPLPVTGDRSRRRRERTVLMVPSEQVLRRTVGFPVQVRENLAKVMHYEIDRLSPFSADQVCFDFIARGGGRSDRLTAELALCRRDQVSAWINRLRELGRPVDQLTWEGGWARANLLPASDRPARNLTLFTIPRLLGVVVLLLVAVVLISPLWQREQLLESTLAELRRLRVEAQQVEEVRSALAQAREGSIAVLRQKLEQPRMTDMLRELTRSLPDDTWIQSLEVRDGEVQLRGESSQATALIELLEREPGVEGVAFRSPVTQVARTGTERFNVAFRYRGVATP